MGIFISHTAFVPQREEFLQSKSRFLANIDVAMGGHVAEQLFIGDDKMTTGCGSDLDNATKSAYRAVRSFGMFGEDAGYISAAKDTLSESYNAMVDLKVQ